MGYAFIYTRLEGLVLEEIRALKLDEMMIDVGIRM